MSTEVRMPKLADTLVEGTLARWLKSARQIVSLGEPIAEIETDKVTTELIAPASGTLGDLLVAEGETVPIGTPLVQILAADAQPGESEGLPHPSPGNDAMPSPQQMKRFSPLAARMAREHGVDLSRVRVTGSRITRADIERHLSQSGVSTEVTSAMMPQVQQVAAAQPPRRSFLPSDELQSLAGLRRATAQRMAAVHQIPTGSAVVEVDITALDYSYRNEREAWMAREGFSLTYTPYIVHALAQSLRAWPAVRAAYASGRAEPREDVHIGVAVALDDGLIVPVIRDADQKDVAAIARAQHDLVSRARSRRLRPEEVTGGVATLTNVGSMGGLLALPMLNEHQAAILGMGAITRRATGTESGIRYRSFMYFSLTFDRRLLDDLQAEHFLRDVARRIEMER